MSQSSDRILDLLISTPTASSFLPLGFLLASLKLAIGKTYIHLPYHCFMPVSNIEADVYHQKAKSTLSSYPCISSPNYDDFELSSSF